MRTLPIVLAVMMTLTQAWAAKDVDLSEFDGNYKGNGTITASGMPYPLTANAKVSVSKNGSTAKVVLSGVVDIDAGVPWGTTLKLKKKGRMTTNNLVGVESGGEIFPGSGKYKLPKSSKLESSAKATVAGNLLVVQKVEMAVKPKGRKKELKVKLTVSVNGMEGFVYNMTLNGR